MTGIQNAEQALEDKDPNNATRLEFKKQERLLREKMLQVTSVLHNLSCVVE